MQQNIVSPKTVWKDCSYIFTAYFYTPSYTWFQNSTSDSPFCA